jgi:hypothetical protein
VAQSYQEDNSTVTANAVTNVLAAPLRPDWTIQGLAEQLLCTIAAQPEKEFVLDAAATTDRQSRRLIRPLLACLANMSAQESGTSDNVFGADLSFKRTGPDGPVWIFGQFQNTQGKVRVMLQRSSSAPERSRENGKLQPENQVVAAVDQQNLTRPTHS